MKEKNIFNTLAELFGKLYGGREKPRDLENYLFKHRLRRNISEQSLADASPSWDIRSGGLANKFFVVLFLLVIGFAPLSTAFAAPFLTMNSFSGNPGVTLQVSGGGYEAGENVSVYLGSGSTPAATATVQADTLFGPVGVLVPAAATQGPMEVRAVGSSSGISESNSYYVVPFSPEITVSAPANTPGSAASIDGTGFAPGETVRFVLSGSTGGHATADGNGNFTGVSFSVPAVPSGTYQLHAIGDSSGADASYYFYVGGFYPSAYPSLYYLLPGDSISFSGSGFGAGEAVEVYMSTSLVSTITADGTGSFTNAGSYALAADTRGGIKTFTLKGAATGVEAAAIMVTVGDFNSLVQPSSFWVTPGSSVSFSGSGFAYGEQVEVYSGTSSTSVASFAADSAGSFENAGSVSIPVSQAGTTVLFTVRGVTSGTSSTVEITVGGLFPSIVPSDWWIVPGQQFTVSGSGFAGGETVKVNAAGTEREVTAGVNGSFEDAGPFTAPFTGSSVAVTAAGVLSGISAPALAISMGSLNPLVSPDAWWVMPGAELHFSGSGFLPGEVINVSTDGSGIATITADSSGSFASSTVSVPYGPERSEIYVFTGTTSGGLASISVQVAGLHPYAEADLYYATPGSTVEVRAHGFGASESVTVSAGGSSQTVNADAYGDTPWVTITLPVSASGSAVITFTGSLSGGTATVPVTLAPFGAQVAPSMWWAYPGSPVSFEGSGFAGGETVIINLKESVVGTVTATAGGTFVSESITIPFSATGSADFSFSGQTSGATAAVSIGLGSLSPGIWLSTYWDVGGMPLKVFGGGFAPGETVTVTFEGSTLGTPKADDSGSFELAATVPYGPAGNKTIQAQGDSSGISAPPATFTQPQVYVNAQLGSYAGAPGDLVTFIGSGYLPGEPIEITTSRTGATLVHSFTADASGSFNDSGFAVPSPGGPLTLTITGTHSHTAKSISYYVTGP